MNTSAYIEDLWVDEAPLVDKNETNEVKEFFNGANIFITGGTGFLGKLLIEKLLRTCPAINNIYMIVRNKKGKDMKSRLADMMDDVVFKQMKKANPEGPKKIIGVYGDVGEEALGLSEDDQKLIAENVDIIFHVAATVNFEEPMKKAVNINVRGTKEILNLAKSCKKLKSFVHVSTAYSNCVVQRIEERVYDFGINSDDLIDLVASKDEDALTEMTPELLGKFPNTYCYTKCAAEHAVTIGKDDLPICIFRPGVVIATYEEPISGWIDNFYGPTGICVGAGTGVIHTVQVGTDSIMDFVPGDMVVNAMITCCFETANLYKNNAKPELKIYNYVASVENPITCSDWLQLNAKYGIDIPTIRAFWYYYLVVTQNAYLHFIYTILMHYLPALIIDGYAILTGNKPQLLSLYKKIHKFSSVISYFSLNTWQFTNDNVQSMWRNISKQAQEMYPFSMSNMSWEKHSQTHLIGLRTYLLKESLDTLPAARIKWQKLKYLHLACKYGLYLLVLRFAWCIGSTFYTIAYKLF